MSSEIGERLEKVRRRISAAAERSGRDPSSITLIAVGKKFPADVVGDAVAAGAIDLGENRVQEAAAKRPQVDGARWHLIGPLQRNKARTALEVFDFVHTIDRVEIADRLQFLLQRDWPERRFEVLLEINLASEQQKAGVVPTDAANLLAHVNECDRLDVKGLMAIPPWGREPEHSRTHFQALRRLRDDLEQSTGVELAQLSMGMSSDFEVAITEGATMVRVGTAIFGPRS